MNDRTRDGRIAKLEQIRKRLVRDVLPGVPAGMPYSYDQHGNLSGWVSEVVSVADRIAAEWMQRNYAAEYRELYPRDPAEEESEP